MLAAAAFAVGVLVALRGSWSWRASCLPPQQPPVMVVRVIVAAAASALVVVMS